MKESDFEMRATLMLEQSDKMGCRKFVRSLDVVKGNPRLNLAFVTNLFNTYTDLKPIEAGLPDFDLGDTEKTFRNWMNSLGVTPFINNLCHDLSDGYVFLQLFDMVKPGCVDWSKVNKPPFKAIRGNIKKLENCNYAMELAHSMGFFLLGIKGSDLQDGSKLILCIVWQLIRVYTLTTLQKLSESDKPTEELAILDWVNNTLEDADKCSTISSFEDPQIATSLPIIDLIDSLRPGNVNYGIVTEPVSKEDWLSNAKYAISN